MSLIDDQSPPDGDFAAYIEARLLTSRIAAPPLRDDTVAGVATPRTTMTATSPASTATVSPVDLAAGQLAPPTPIQAEVMRVLRAVAAGLLLLGIAGLFPPPLSVALRVGGFALFIYAARRALSPGLPLRSLLRERLEQARKAMVQAPTRRP